MLVNNHFSYVDTSLRVIYINNQSSANLESFDEIGRLLEMSETSKYARQELLAMLLTNELRSSQELRTVLDHEKHHYLQTLFYPFLYYLCWLEFDNLEYLRAQFRESKEPQIPISMIGLPEDFSANLRFTSYKVHFFWKGDILHVKPVDDNSPSAETFSLIDLIEDATSIFQYKMTVDKPDFVGCYNWIMEIGKNRYKRFYKFISKQIGKKRAYDLLPMLVQLAFFSTEPFSMFCNALSLTNYKFADYECFTVQENFQRILLELQKNIGTWETDALDYSFITKMPVKIFTHEDLRTIINYDLKSKKDVHFPVSLHALKFIDLVKSDSETIYRLMLADEEDIKGLMAEFEPMAIHFRFVNRVGRDSMILVGKDYRNQISPQGVSYDGYLKEIIKVQETSKHLFTRAHDILSSNCHHTSCGYYSLGLCKKWNSIPKNYAECGFPYWFSWVYLRRINLQSGNLDICSRQIAEQDWAEYTQRSHRHRPFHYIKVDGKFTLTLSKEEFTSSENHKLFPQFIEYLKSLYGKCPEDLSGSINLDIYGYNLDKREVFEVSEIRHWMQNTLAFFPDFLCYIDFLPPSQQHVFIKPCLIKHTKIVRPDNRLDIRFDQKELSVFSHSQSATFYNFKYLCPKINSETLFRNLNMIINGN